MKNYLLLTALFDDASLLCEFYRTASECRCNIHESRLSSFQTIYALSLSLTGKWDAIAKVEIAFEQMKNKNTILLNYKRAKQLDLKPEFLSYSMQLNTLDKPGLLHSVCEFFVDQSILIHEVHSTTFESVLTKTPMGFMTITILVPVDTNIAELRENFFEFCDSLNIDAVIEPDKL